MKITYYQVQKLNRNDISVTVDVTFRQCVHLIFSYTAYWQKRLLTCALSYPSTLSNHHTGLSFYNIFQHLIYNKVNNMFLTF
jgi:hypothetical protein